SVKDGGGKPYPIPAGASVHKYGALGYIGFAEEVTRQEAELGFKFDYIVVCVVTGSTQAGMIVGFAAQDRADRVIGIDASGTLDQTRAQVRSIVDNTSELIGLMNSKQFADWQAQMGIAVGQEWEPFAGVGDVPGLKRFLANVPFFSKGPRRHDDAHLDVPPIEIDNAREISTQAAFGKILDY